MFTTAGGVTANGIAHWDPVSSSWHTLGGGLSGGAIVFSLAVGPEGSLYAGGHFTDCGGVGASNIARWDYASATWSSMGSGMNSTVWALAVGPDGSLYAGGDFSSAGGVAADHIARWDGASWHPLGSGMNNAIWSLAVGPDGAVYAGGRFSSAGGVPASGIARWDGFQWHALGSGMNGEVLVMAVAPDGSLYAGGQFTRAGDVTARNIARWDGASWQPLVLGMDGAVSRRRSHRMAHSMPVDALTPQVASPPAKLPTGPISRTRNGSGTRRPKTSPAPAVCSSVQTAAALRPATSSTIPSPGQVARLLSTSRCLTTTPTTSGRAPWAWTGIRTPSGSR